MGRDIGRERRLLDAHILEPAGTAAQSAIEAEIKDLQTDFAQAATTYQPLTTLPEENSAWRKLEAHVQAIREPLASTLAFSQRNEDEKARESLRLLEGRFEEIREGVDALIQMNREGTSRQVQEIARLQHAGRTFETLLTFAGLTVTTIVGWWAGRLVRRREDQLAQYSSMLEDKNRDLDAFAGRVAHDLRAPLATINIAVWKLSNKMSGKDDAVPILQNGIRHMHALIGDFLTMSRVGYEQIGACDPAVAAAQVQKDLALQIEQAGGLVCVKVTPSKVRGTDGLLYQALWNLADNAVKYRKPEVPVHLEIEGKPETHVYELRVSDNGLGMEAADSNKAFEPFYRVSPSDHVPGTGLGLTIVKRIVEVSGGTVSVDSKRGRGTTFIINLPLAHAESIRNLKV
jgi:signal transduction histidine kinase